MKNKKGTSLLKIDNFLVETDKINSSDETFNKLMFLYSAALKQLERMVPSPDPNGQPAENAHRHPLS